MNTKAAGKAALHCASVGGHVDVVKAILEFSPDLEVEVRNVVFNGNMALELGAFRVVKWSDLMIPCST